MNLDEAYKYIQDLFRRGLTTVVGSGASCALGLPSMEKLRDHLLASIPPLLAGLSSSASSAWKQISESLESGEGLEAALKVESLPTDLADQITIQVASLVGEYEREAVGKMMSSKVQPTFGTLFSHILQNNDIADVVTTNYDRLLEVAAAISSVRVDTMFYGHTLGRLDERLSREELLEPLTFSRPAARVKLRTRGHVRLAKPHGSLDWFEHNGTVVRSEMGLPGARQIVAPGASKYRLGYHVPFDLQRTRANSAIDGASAFLIVGYGFNDDHLETHLKAAFPRVPAVVLARDLTDNAKSFLASNSTALGIESNPAGSGSRLIRGTDELVAPVDLWQLEVLLKEALGK